jgi:hypothetical protein
MTRAEKGAIGKIFDIIKILSIKIPESERFSRSLASTPLTRLINKSARKQSCGSHYSHIVSESPVQKKYVSSYTNEFMLISMAELEAQGESLK